MKRARFEMWSERAGEQIKRRRTLSVLLFIYGQTLELLSYRAALNLSVRKALDPGREDADKFLSTPH